MQPITSKQTIGYKYPELPWLLLHVADVDYLDHGGVGKNAFPQLLRADIPVAW